jgi:hypothetical protein
LLPKNIKIKTCRTIILPVVLHGCKTWSLIIREDRRLRVFENKVLWRIFGPKRDEVTGGWRSLYEDEPNDLNSSNIFRAIESGMRWVGHVARMGRGQVHTGLWWGNLIGDQWDYSGVDGRIIIKMDIQEVGEWTGLSWLRIEKCGVGGACK